MSWWWCKKRIGLQHDFRSERLIQSTTDSFLSQHSLAENDRRENVIAVEARKNLKMV